MVPTYRSVVRFNNIIATCVVYAIFVVHVSCKFQRPTPEHEDLHMTSLVKATNPCKGSQTCEDSFTEQQCYSKRVCTLNCRSRTTSFPTKTILINNSNCGGNPQPSPPSGVNTSNKNFFTSASINVGCTQNETVIANPSTGNFALSFWIQGRCTTKCYVLRLGSSLKVELNGEKLAINDQTLSNTPSISTDGWQHVVIRKRSSDNLELYVNQTVQTLTLTDSLQSATAVLGPSSNMTGNDSYMVLDARFYADGITKREIDELYSGTFPPVSLIPDCRCPLSHPDISSNGRSCSDVGGSDTVKRLDKDFHNAQDILNDSKSWASSSGNFVLNVELSTSFQIKQVTVTFNGTTPSSSKWEFDNGSTTENIDETLYDLNVTSCTLKSANIPNYQTFEKTLAEKIKVTFTGNSTPIFIEDIAVVGWCDCDGSGSNCNKSSASSSYMCTCDQNTAGPNCKVCKNTKYRQPSGFGCLNGCDCYDPGVNTSDVCESVGGMCKCKQNVMGKTCDTCKRLTYNLTMGNPDGCNRSSCDDFGSVDCNNVTGSCDCRPNVVGNNCDKCKDKHYGRESETGCYPCNCTTAGTRDADDTCNVNSGQCNCKSNTHGRVCGECRDTYHSLKASNSEGCSKCGCNDVGTNNMTCNKSTGQCMCRGDDYTNKQCIPQIEEPDPNFGPIRGGTTVTIRGHYLNNNPRISIGNIPQNFIARNDRNLVITTKDWSSSVTTNLTVDLLNSTETRVFKFTYKPNPAVNMKEIPQELKASARGGCSVIIPGTNLNSVDKPLLRINIGTNQSNTTVCTHMGSDGKSIKCPTPSWENLSETIATVDLTMDGTEEKSIANVTLTQNADITGDMDIEFAPPFEKRIKISGKNIGADCDREDYSVYIGAEGYPCEVNVFTESEIECEPPQDPPENAPTTPERVYEIKVKIGTSVLSVGTIYYKQFWLTTYFVYIMVGSGLFLIAALVLAICICCYRCRRRNREQSMDTRAQSTNSTMVDESYQNGRTVDIPLIEPQNKPIIKPFDNPAYEVEQGPNADEVVTIEYFLHRVEESIRSRVKDSLIGETNFTPGNICIAKGKYARLIDGTFTSKSKINPNQKVTIKMLIKPLPDTGVLSPRNTAALRECLRLKPHSDDNVLSMHGIGLDRKRFYIIYPYMEKKTLKDHIVDPNQNYVLRQLLEYILQVSEGMEYLSERGLVHKDLALRNCMVDAKDMVKISDAAFTWDFYPDEYMYDELKDRYLPVRWMAPESLKTGFYDTKSDVWAFGVLMWELLTRGILPFQELRNEEVQDYIEDGYRLGKPHMVPDDKYELMNSCWQNENEYRPTFRLIEQELASSLTNRQSMNEDLYINSEAIDSVYINQDEIQRLRENASRRH